MNITANNNLKFLRNQKAVSRAEVAKAIGKTVSYYGMLENGERIPSLLTAAKIAKYFDLKIEEIFLIANTTNSCLKKVSIA